MTGGDPVAADWKKNAIYGRVATTFCKLHFSRAGNCRIDFGSITNSDKLTAPCLTAGHSKITELFRVKWHPTNLNALLCKAQIEKLINLNE